MCTCLSVLLITLRLTIYAVSDSRFPIPDSRFPIPCSLLPAPFLKQ
ncbi:hypothetical protein [Moorena sp. SIO3H5]|nr:hypothetical protein [Moorena sp. SIO3H5]NEO69779.1 hypothetical protein [Moorena sp. SIO3H5]